MSGDRIIQFIVGAVGTTIMLLVVIAFFDTFLSSSAALQPGDPFYPQQRGLVDAVATILPWLAPGALGVAVLIIAMLRDGF